jgi:rhodanese-related sulfurtransferase
MPLPRVLSLTLSLFVSWLTLVAQAQQALPVSAHEAERALVRGAVVLDVRTSEAYAQGHLPGAVSAPQALAAKDRAALQQLVSERGVDLSREVLVVGELADARTMAFASELARYASGRVNWLVGGLPEWRMTGRSVSLQTHSLAAVPQFLTPLHSAPTEPRMAAQALRHVLWPAPALDANLEAKLADGPRQ